MESLDSELADALSTLLEDARANVEILVELTNGATEITERELCTELGQDAVLLSCVLRERLALAGAPITRRINGIVPYVLDAERYDDRLRAFGRHQASMSERAQSLSQTTEDRETRAVLRELYDATARGALWCEQRAAAFANSRLLEFHPNRLSATLTGSPQTPGQRDAGASATDAPASAAAYPHDAAQADVQHGNGVSSQEPAREVNGENSEQPHSSLRHDGASGPGSDEGE